MLNDAGLEKEIEKLLNKKDEHLMNCITLGYSPKEVIHQKIEKFKGYNRIYFII